MAVRATQYCKSNEILIDYAVNRLMMRDFVIKRMDSQERESSKNIKKKEEEMILFILKKLKSDIVDDPESLGCFIYTFEILGKSNESKQLTDKSIEKLSYLPGKINQKDLVKHWNRLIASKLSYLDRLDILKKMRKEGIQPDVVTYSTLIAKAPDYEAAKSWVEAMEEEGIQPDVVTYSTLIAKAPNYEAAKSWVEAMEEEGIQPDVVTYNTLFSDNLFNVSADDLLKWYLDQKSHPEEPIQAALAFYRNYKLIDQALRLTLDYPHLPAARKILKIFSQKALSYFENLLQHNPQHPNANYSLGITLMELKRFNEAQPYLKKALKLARASPRKAMIKEWLRQIEQNNNS